MPYINPFDKTRLVYSWLAVGGPCMWPECPKASEHVHHIQPRRWRGCSHDANLIALCRGHHGGGNGEIHAKWEDHETTLRDFRELAFEKLLYRVEHKALVDAIKEYRRLYRWKSSKQCRRVQGVSARECHNIKLHIGNLKVRLVALEAKIGPAAIAKATEQGGR